MDDGMNETKEEDVLNEYATLIEEARPAIGDRLFYDVMPPWEVFREYRMAGSVPPGTKS